MAPDLENNTENVGPVCGHLSCRSEFSIVALVVASSLMIAGQQHAAVSRMCSTRTSNWFN